MKKSLLIFSTFLFGFTGVMYAQQDMLLTHFMYNKMMFNPGETGIDDGICANLAYRNQWDKINGAPNSAVLNIEANLERWVSAGVGLTFTHDAIGFSRQNNLLLNYSHHIPFGSVGTLGAGVGIGIINFGMNPTWVPPVTQNDLLLPSGFAATNLDLNFGLYFKGYAIPFYAGLSSTHLSAPRLNSIGTVGGVDVNQTYQTARHYYFMGGYKLGLGNGDDIDAQTIVRHDAVKISADINARYIYDNMLYGGLTYRTSDAVAIMGGYMMQLGSATRPTGSAIIGYSYDYTLNKLSSISKGSHEIFLKYCYYLPPIPVVKSKHPRWL